MSFLKHIGYRDDIKVNKGIKRIVESLNDALGEEFLKGFNFHHGLDVNSKIKAKSRMELEMIFRSIAEYCKIHKIEVK